MSYKMQYSDIADKYDDQRLYASSYNGRGYGGSCDSCCVIPAPAAPAPQIYHHPVKDDGNNGNDMLFNALSLGLSLFALVQALMAQAPAARKRRRREATLHFHRVLDGRSGKLESIEVWQKMMG